MNKHNILRCGVLVIGSLQGAQLLMGQSALPLVRIGETSTRADGSVKALVTVTDSEGRALRDLGGANFSVTAEGKDVKPLGFNRAGQASKPLSVVLALDVSGSMKGVGIAGAVRGASAFLDRLNKQDFCALLAFGSGVRLVDDFTTDRDRLKEDLAGLRAVDAKTYLYQALFDALDRAAVAPSSRAALVVLTDGKDEGSSLGLQDVLTKATIKDVPIYSLGYGPNADTETLRRVSAVSRGTFFAAPDAGQLAVAYNEILDQLQSEYALTFMPPARASAFTVILAHRGETVSATHSLVSEVKAEGTTARGFGSASILRSPSTWYAATGLAVCLALATWLWMRSRSKMDPQFAATMVPPRVWLEVVRGADTGQKFLLFDKEATVGRNSRRAQIALNNDPLVGGQHARLRLNEQGQYVLEDLKSKNGVSVNGVRIAEPVILQPNDRIELGLTEMVFMDQR
jgi:VWFA-related protein